MPLTPLIIGGIVFIISPVFLPNYLQSLMTKVAIFAILAISLDLIMGYTGLMSLGHAAYFGVAGYTAAILMKSYGIDNFWIVAPCAIMMATVAAALLGIICLRVSGSHFLIVTFALGMVLYALAVKSYWLTKGSEGIQMIAPPNLGLSWLQWNSVSFYYFVLIIFIVSFFIMYRLVNSPFGHALQGIRENERRMRTLGYNTWLYKYIAFIIAGFFAGVAGMLFPYYSGVMVPYTLGITTSTLVMLFCIIGGLGTLWGPVFGTLSVIFVEYLSGLFIPDHWSLVLGSVFVISVMFLRGGIAKYLRRPFLRKVPFGSSES